MIELVTGLLITVGFFTRIAAIVAAGQMAVAYFWKHWGVLGGEPSTFWPFGNGGNGGEVAILFCFGFLLLATTGAGAWSIDERRRSPQSPPADPASRVLRRRRCPRGGNRGADSAHSALGEVQPASRAQAGLMNTPSASTVAPSESSR